MKWMYWAQPEPQPYRQGQQHDINPDQQQAADWVESERLDRWNEQVGRRQNGVQVRLTRTKTTESGHSSVNLPQRDHNWLWPWSPSRQRWLSPKRWLLQAETSLNSDGGQSKRNNGVRVAWINRRRRKSFIKKPSRLERHGLINTYISQRCYFISKINRG